MSELASINPNKMTKPDEFRMIGLLLFMHLMASAYAVGELQLLWVCKIRHKLQSLSILQFLWGITEQWYGLPLCIIVKCVCTPLVIYS